MHCVGGQPLVSVLFVGVLITLFLLKTFSLLVIYVATPKPPNLSVESLTLNTNF